MREFQQGQIWIINFDPSFGHEYKKVRPGLIIQSNDYVEYGSLLTIIPISSRIEKKVNLDVFLPKTINNRLMKDSLIKTRQISSFDKKRFIKFVGNCEVPVLQSVKDMLRKYLSL